MCANVAQCGGKCDGKSGGSWEVARLAGRVRAYLRRAAPVGVRHNDDQRGAAARGWALSAEMEPLRAISSLLVSRERRRMSALTEFLLVQKAPTLPSSLRSLACRTSAW